MPKWDKCDDSEIQFSTLHVECDSCTKCQTSTRDGIIFDTKSRTHVYEMKNHATHGNAVHVENMAKLQKTFKFGKWKSIYNSQRDHAGRTFIQDQASGFHVHQAKFVQERLFPVVIPRGRRSDKKFETTDGKKRQLRAVWSSANRVQRETRPGVSALASLGMGSLNHSTVQDLCDANMAVERLRAEPSLGVKLPHIPIHQVRWAAVQDASWANAAHLPLLC